MLFLHQLKMTSEGEKMGGFSFFSLVCIFMNYKAGLKVFFIFVFLLVFYFIAVRNVKPVILVLLEVSLEGPQ